MPNLITNLDISACAEAKSTSSWMKGIRYAIDRLHTLSNVTIYPDIAHSGWIGRDSDFSFAGSLYANVFQGAASNP